MIANIQRRRIIEFLKEGKRFDGRTPLDLRDIKVDLNISENAEGSVAVKCGETEVYAGVKMSIITPYADGPKEGTLSVSMEMNPMADDEFDFGAPSIESIEMARVIDRGLRESGMIDFEKLCIKEGEKVWQISLDLVAINNAGNLFDIAGLAAVIALANAKIPVYNAEKNKIEHKLSEESVPLVKENISFNFTVHKVGDSLILDPSRDEEEVSDWRVCIAVGEFDGKARITAMQKGKEGPIDERDMESVLNLVEDKFLALYKKFMKLAYK